MTQLEDKQLLKLIKIVPISSFVMFVVIINALLLSSHKSNTTQSLIALEQQLISDQKWHLKNQVSHIVQTIDFNSQNHRQKVNEHLKNRVHEVLTMAEHLYITHPQYTENELKALIINAIRPLRYNNGRGYYYIFDADGTNLLNSHFPEFETLHVTQTHKQNINAEHQRQLIKETLVEGSNLTQYWCPKPGKNKKKLFEKISYATLFKPYNWIIGSGEYLEDVKEEFQKKVLSEIHQMTIKNSNYIFVLNSQGTLLSHRDPAIIGQNLINSGHPSAQRTISKLIEAAISGEEFVHYINPTSVKPVNKLSYVTYLPDWDWIIGTGIAEEELTNLLNTQRTLLNEQNKHSRYKLLAIGFICTVLLSTIYLFFIQKLTQRFSRYQQKIKYNFEQLNNIKNQLEFTGSHDGLTTLPNRQMLRDDLSELLNNARDNQNHIGVMFVDLDDFKKINDIHGHTQGDSLLAQSATIFKQILSPDDKVYRFGGDEFIFTFTNSSSQDEVIVKVNQVLQSIKQLPIILNDKQIYLSLSAGLTLYPEHGKTLDELLLNADMALHKAKSLGKNSLYFFDLALLEERSYQRTLEVELVKAVKEKQIYVQFQPQITLHNHQLYGVEALARWNNPILGQVPPPVFIEKAEELGLISQLGDHIIEIACQQIIEYQKQTKHPLRLSVNISPQRISDDNFVESLFNRVTRLGFLPKQITLEITENVLINDLDHVEPILNQLRDLGFHIALDDFGTGYSSLSYLNNLPINELKIDRSFIDKLTDDQQNASLVKAILAMSRSLGMRVVAEGIEIQEQSDWLCNSSCEIGQGYLYSKPISLKQLLKHYEQYQLTSISSD